MLTLCDPPVTGGSPSQRASNVDGHWDTGKYSRLSRYRAVQHNMLLHMVRKWLKHSMLQRIYSQTTPHISPSRASYGVSFMRIRVKIDRVITAPHCILESAEYPMKYAHRFVVRWCVCMCVSLCVCVYSRVPSAWWRHQMETFSA